MQLVITGMARSSLRLASHAYSQSLATSSRYAASVLRSWGTNELIRKKNFSTDLAEERRPDRSCLENNRLHMIAERLPHAVIFRNTAAVASTHQWQLGQCAAELGVPNDWFAFGEPLLVGKGRSIVSSYDISGARL